MRKNTRFHCRRGQYFSVGKRWLVRILSTVALSCIFPTSKRMFILFVWRDLGQPIWFRFFSTLQIFGLECAHLHGKSDSTNGKSKRSKNIQSATFNRGVQFEDELLCTKCDRKFTSKNGFMSHMRSHQGQFKFWCDECKKGFQNKNNYDRHMGRHEGRTFPCQYCTKRFAYEYQLKYHMASHVRKYWTV